MKKKKKFSGIKKSSHKKRDPHKWLHIKTNACRSLIDGLMGVHVSSIGSWGYEDNFKPVYFFYTKKNLSAKKHSLAKTN